METLDNCGIKKYQVETLCFKARLMRLCVAFTTMHATFPFDIFYSELSTVSKRENCSIKFCLATAHCYSPVTERFSQVLMF